jgi:hypothetical protein
MSREESGPLPTVVDARRSTSNCRCCGRGRRHTPVKGVDAIAAARRRLPMVEVAADGPLLGPHAR